MFYNNGCHKCEERLDERIILRLISEAQGAYLEVQGVHSKAHIVRRKAHIVRRKTHTFEAHKVGGKDHKSRIWKVKTVIMSLM